MYAIQDFMLSIPTKVRTLTLLIFSILLSSCSSLKTPQRTNLVSLKAPRIIGQYPVIIHKENYLNRPSNIVVWNHFIKHANADSLEVKQATHFQLELIDRKNITATLFKGDHVLITRDVKGKIKNGYFRLKHRLKITGIPPLLWGLSSEKTQLGIGNNQELYIDSSSTRNGGFLFFLAGTPDITMSDTIQPYNP